MKNAAKTNWVLNVSDADFETEVAQRSLQVPVVVDFWSPSCAPCRTLGPILESLAREKKGEFVLAKVNVDQAFQIAGYFQIESVPTVVALKNAELVDHFVGLIPESQIKEFINRLCPMAGDQLMEEALAAETSNPKRAEKIYQDILAKDANSDPARLGLARMKIAGKKFAEALELLAQIDESGEAATEIRRLRSIIELHGSDKPQGDEGALRKKLAADPNNALLRYELGELLTQKSSYEAALAMLLSAAELDRNLGRTQVRELMVKIFQIIGVRSEMADDYRARLQAMIY